MLSPDGNLKLEVDVVNVPRVRVTIFKVHENNLVPHCHHLARDKTSRELARKEFDLDLPPHQLRPVALDLKGLLPSERGLYLLEIADPRYRWRRDQAIVSITDLGLTAKRGRNGLTVFVTSLTGAGGVAGAEVAVLSRTNQVMARGVTGENGAARLELAEDHPEGAPFLVTARRDEPVTDISFLRLDLNPWVFSEVGQTGREPPRHYDLMLYPDRGVYRPGETVHLTGILRWADGRVPPAFPLAMKVVRPDGHQTAELTAHPGPQGVFHLHFPVPEEGQTGPWLFRATLPASTGVLGSATVLIEAFLPARIELETKAAHSLAARGEEQRLTLAARYLFDQPAAGLPLQVRYRYAPKSFESKAHPDYVFETMEEIEAKEGRVDGLLLDAEGRAEIKIPPPPEAPPAHYRLTLTATVTEPGSRSVSKTVVVAADTAPRHVGLQSPSEGFMPIGAEVPIRFLALSPTDREVVPGALSYRIYRVEHDYEHLLVDGRTTWRSVERLIKVDTGELKPQSSGGEIPIRLKEWGRYRLLLTDDETGLTSRLDLYAATDYSGARSLALKSVERLELVPERGVCAPGEVVPVLVRSPFAGTLLLSLESADVEVLLVEVLPGAEATVNVPVPDHLRGGALLTAAVIRPVLPESEDWRPHRALGAVRIETRHDARRIPVTITAPDQAPPGGTIEVAVAVNPDLPGGPALLHLFAVDEGILLTANTRTPDPHAHFFSPRKSTVATTDLFPDLLPDFKRPASMLTIGGGASPEQRALRRNPVPTKRKLPAVIWREAVLADTEGRAAFNLDLPELTGALRLMAVAVSGDRYGSAEQRVVLTSPLMIEAGWPRFLAPGDRVQVPLKLLNTTGSDLSAAVQIDIDGPAKRIDEAVGGKIDVPANGAVTVFVAIEATGIGPVEISATAVAGTGERGVSGARFPVRPATPLIVKSVLNRVPAGETIEFPAAEGFLAGAHRTLTFSAEPALDLRPAVESLIAYPYGCVEQTTSRLMAILNAPQLLDGETDRKELIADMIRRGMERYRDMQTRDGGLAYWPGNAKATLWGSAYAGAFLARARAAGHELPTGLMPDLLTYLKREIGAERTTLAEQAMIVRVLAEFDRPATGWMARLAELRDELDIEGRAHLAAAFLATGRRDRAISVLPDDIEGITVPTTTAGRLTSTVRQLAVLLDVLLDLEPAGERVPFLTARLNDARIHGRWNSTLNDASAVAALTRAALAREQVQPDYRLTMRCGDLLVTADHLESRTVTLPVGEAPVTVTVQGTGATHLYLRTEGLADRVDGHEHDRGLTVRKTWRGQDGNIVDPRRLEVGDLVRVEVTLTTPPSKRSLTIGNVAVVDPLPGGFEVENPRLATSAGRDLVQLSAADRVEFLDDRVVLFTSADANTRRFSWFLRVVSVGNFTIPPVQASCMYRPELSSISGKGKLEVRR